MSKYKFVKQKKEKQTLFNRIKDVFLNYLFYGKKTPNGTIEGNLLIGWLARVLIVSGTILSSLWLLITLLPIPKGEIHNIPLFITVLLLFTIFPIILGHILLFLNKTVKFEHSLNKKLKAVQGKKDKK